MSRGWESVKKQPGIWQTAGITGAAALFALWHFQDVRNGAAASGDLWLQGILRPSCGIWAFACRGAGISGSDPGTAVHRAFFFSAPFLGTGLMFMTVLAPLSAPDEVSHYITAYQLSNRFLGGVSRMEDGRVPIRGSGRVYRGSGRRDAG